MHRRPSDRWNKAPLVRAHIIAHASGGAATADNNRLELLGIKASFTVDSSSAKWALEPFVAELQPIGDGRARMLISAYGELHHASEPAPQSQAGATILADGLALLLGGPPDPKTPSLRNSDDGPQTRTSE